MHGPVAVMVDSQSAPESVPQLLSQMHQTPGLGAASDGKMFAFQYKGGNRDCARGILSHFHFPLRLELAQIPEAALLRASVLLHPSASVARSTVATGARSRAGVKGRPKRHLRTRQITGVLRFANFSP